MSENHVHELLLIGQTDNGSCYLCIVDSFQVARLLSDQLQEDHELVAEEKSIYQSITDIYVP